ncbi:MAG: GH92 family glycosyl hydrolase [Breznakibacter sp.]
MYKFCSFLLAAVLGTVLWSCGKQQRTDLELIQYVNTFVGTDGPGNTYPGAVYPFGMVQLSPDNGLPGWDRIAGYFWPDSTIAGFSHTHLSGTGAGDMYDLLVMPLNSRFTESLTPEGDYRPYSLFRHEQESAHPGYYKVLLESSGITAELTTTQRVGFHRYSFPKDDASKIILDLGYALNWDAPVETQLQVVDNQTITGYRFSSGWAPDQRVFFVMKLSRPFDAVHLSLNGETVTGESVMGKKTAIVFDYATQEQEQIMAKVALSSASVDGAMRNMEQELNHWDFDGVVKQTATAWENALSTIEIKGTEEQKRIFYTNLYHCFVTPSLHSDVDGFYKGADGNMQQAKGYDRYDTFSLWDTYRTAHPLYTIIAPDKVRDMVASFLAHYDETGLLPVWSIAGNETNMMIGYHAVPVIVDAYFKGIPMDAQKALEACVASATVAGRQIDEYMKYGYVPVKEGAEWSLSMTLEYAYGDWCIAQLAKALGKDDVYKMFDKRSQNWKNAYDATSTFMRPKDQSGNFIPGFKDKDYSIHYCESNAWHYLWSVQHDIPGLIDTLGVERFTAKLDSMFTYYPAPDDKLPIFSTGMIGQYAHGNEPSHHVAYLYNYVGQPDKTQQRVREIIETQYHNTPNGFCGNEDCGQMSAWLVMSSIGMYPVNPANGVYDLTSPWMEEAVINLADGKQFKIVAENQSPENVYVQKVLLNGRELNKMTIHHSDVVKGGELRFVLGPNPKK